MTSFFEIRRPIHPLVVLLLVTGSLVFGLALAKEINVLYFYLGVFLFYLIWGYWKACLAVVPVAAFFAGVFAGLTYAISRDELETYAAANRALALFVSVIPSLAMRPIDLVRALNQLKIPRRITLGMLITLTFFPLLRREVKIIREAMRTRGANSIFAPAVLYRSFVIPLVLRLVNISDTLSLSVETRGFTFSKEPYTIYRPPRFSLLDVLPILLLALGMTGVILL